ncbi:MAG TPA: flagellar biosynthesis protein FlgJ [Firmicutes bacterium]|nr:flagellar biosynthesis protein FlgJ [Bacillota bacterium]
MRVNWDPRQNITARAEELEKRKSTSQQGLEDAARQFESLFLHQLLTEMRRTVPDTDLLGNRRAEKLFQSLLDQEMAEHSSKNQGIGLAEMIYEQMSRFVAADD